MRILLIVLMVLVITMVVVMMIMVRLIRDTMLVVLLNLSVEGDYANIIFIAAAAGQTHGSATNSTERTLSSRPATTSTSALPHGQRRIKSRRAKSRPHDRQCAAPRVWSITKFEPSSGVPEMSSS